MKNRNQCGSEDVTNFMVISFNAQTSECQLFFFFFYIYLLRLFL